MFVCVCVCVVYMGGNMCVVEKIITFFYRGMLFIMLSTYIPFSITYTRATTLNIDYVYILKCVFSVVSCIVCMSNSCDICVLLDDNK